MDRWDNLDEPDLLRLARGAILRLRRQLRTGSPTLSIHFGRWVESLSGGAAPERYFTHPQAFPMLLLPWWLEVAIRGSVTRAFQREVVYSTITGYYFVRMIDDAMDAAPSPPAELLPALIVLHTEFQGTYQRLFPVDQPFWTAFVAASYEAAETASRDARVREIDRAEFLRVSSRKIAGAKVPIAAVCHHHGRAELIEPWTKLVELLGRWHQMRNDIFDWRRDLERGTPTHFLNEASRHAGPDGSITGWVMREGLEWGMGELDGWMEELLSAAAVLDSPALLAYLEGRRETVESEWRALKATFAPLRRLASLLG